MREKIKLNIHIDSPAFPHKSAFNKAIRRYIFLNYFQSFITILSNFSAYNWVIKSQRRLGFGHCAVLTPLNYHLPALSLLLCDTPLGIETEKLVNKKQRR